MLPRPSSPVHRHGDLGLWPLPERATETSDMERVWYAIRIFYRQVDPVRAYLEETGTEYFYPMHVVEKFEGGTRKYVEEPLAGPLLFVRCDLACLKGLRNRFSGEMAPYYDSLTRMPLVVPDSQMDSFIALCNFKDSDLEYLGDDAPKYHEGDLVRVTDGVFKGLVGHVRRIRHDRRLVVTIDGVAAFATGHIPFAFLEKVEDSGFQTG